MGHRERKQDAEFKFSARSIVDEPTKRWREVRFDPAVNSLYLYGDQNGLVLRMRFGAGRNDYALEGFLAENKAMSITVSTFLVGVPPPLRMTTVTAADLERAGFQVRDATDAEVMALDPIPLRRPKDDRSYRELPRWWSVLRRQDPADATKP
jgi:hypothetical protein